MTVAQGYFPSAAKAIVLPISQPVAYVNLDADGCVEWYDSRGVADYWANHNRTHVITIYSDGSTTTEAVS